MKSQILDLVQFGNVFLAFPQVFLQTRTSFRGSELLLGFRFGSILGGDGLFGPCQNMLDFGLVDENFTVEQLENVVLKFPGSILDVLRVPVGPVDEQERPRFWKLGNGRFRLFLLYQFFVQGLQGFVSEAQLVLLVEALVEYGEDVDNVVFLVEVVSDLG